MRIFLESLGCRLNYAEMAALGRQVAGAGHELVASADQADLCVLNSCAVTGEAARQSRQLARQMARANPAARLVVTGCYATLEAETVAALPNVELVVGNQRKEKLWALIKEGSRNVLRAGDRCGSPADSTEASDAIPDARHLPTTTGAEYALRTTHHASRTRAFVKAQDGCRNRCTFCIVSAARGAERSRPAAEVVAEVNALHAEGYQEAVLTGVHLGGYGSDLGQDLRALVVALLADTTIPRLRLSSLEPFDLAPAFFDLWAESDGRLMPHLHLPAQSGSDAVLRRMARRNRVAHFEALVDAARACIPGVTVTTDLIAGFPGETEADFADTMAFVRRAGFAHMHIFPYSARAGTAAARFGGQLLRAERKRRVHVLAELDAELGATVRSAFVGQVRPVLWENRDLSLHSSSPAGLLASELASREAGKRHGEIGIWSGLTDNYLRVLAAVPAGLDLHNRIVPVRLAHLNGVDLWGEIPADGGSEG